MPLAFFRIVVGFMVWRHTWAFIRRYVRSGFYQDVFYVPYWDWFPLPSEPVYLTVMVLMMVAGFLIILGYKTRWALATALSCGWFHLLLNQYWFSNNRYFLLLCLLLLLVSPCDGALSVDAVRQQRPAWGPTWTCTMIRVQMTCIYLASAISKTLDNDWRSGRVLWDRGLIVADYLRATHAPPIVIEWVSNRTLWDILTVLALVTEYFLALGLWLPWTRRLAIWVGLIFHSCIEVAASVLAFSYLTLGTYFLVISPAAQNRTVVYNPHLRRHRWRVTWLRRLDWFDKIVWVGQDIATIRAQDTDGRWYQSWMALCVAGSAMVMPYMIAYPLTWLRWLGVGRIQPATATGQSPTPFHTLLGAPYALLILVVLLLGYVGFLWIATTTHALYLRSYQTKFIDIPLMFVIFALIVAAHAQKSDEA